LLRVCERRTWTGSLLIVVFRPQRGRLSAIRIRSCAFAPDSLDVQHPKLFNELRFLRHFDGTVECFWPTFGLYRSSYFGLLRASNSFGLTGVISPALRVFLPRGFFIASVPCCYLKFSVLARHVSSDACLYRSSGTLLTLQPEWATALAYVMLSNRRELIADLERSNGPARP